MAEIKPTEGQIREARDGVASRGWQKSKAAHHQFCPVGIRDNDRAFRPCEHCHAATNPARWPLFFRAGEHAGELLWTCSTCKLAHADSRGVATVLVEQPRY
jgi:hypothetical protein